MNLSANSLGMLGSMLPAHLRGLKVDSPEYAQAKAGMPAPAVPMTPGQACTALNGCGPNLSTLALYQRAGQPEAMRTQPLIIDGGVEAALASGIKEVPRAFLIRGEACLVNPADVQVGGIDVGYFRQLYDQLAWRGLQPDVAAFPVSTAPQNWLVAVTGNVAGQNAAFLAISVRISVSPLNFVMYRMELNTIAGLTPLGAQSVNAALPTNVWNQAETCGRGVSTFAAANLFVDVLSPTVEILFPMLMPRAQRVAPLPVLAQPSGIVAAVGVDPWVAALNGTVSTVFNLSQLPPGANVIARVAGFNTDLLPILGNSVECL